MAARSPRLRTASEVVRSTWFKVTAALVAVGALVTGAVAAGGYDVAQTKVDDGSVWALQTGSGNRYARVNTQLGELETVKSVANPSDLAQASGHVLVYAQNDAKVASVDLAQPADLTSSDAGFASTPAGTASVAHTGDYVAYLTDTGSVYVSELSGDVKAAPTQVLPGGSASKARSYSADAIAIGTDGVLYSYSRADGAVLRYDIRAHRVLGTDSLSDGPTKPGSTLTVVGDTWALLASGGGTLWIRGGSGPITTHLGSQAVLQQSSGAQRVVVVADQSSLHSFALGSGQRRTLDTGRSGTPAAPAWSGDRLYAAWLPIGQGPGTLWTGRATLAGASGVTRHTLSYGSTSATTPNALEALAAPVFRLTGSGAILNDTTSGLVWTVPDGALVKGSVDWSLTDTRHAQDTQQVDNASTVTDPEPPVAVDDHFGVRAGALVSLPVLLNDHDPNKDVLTIVPDSVQGLDPAFGTVQLASGAQTITVQVGADPPPSASFSYTITDGTASGGGRQSARAATVTLDLHGADTNGAPSWCGGDPACVTVQGTQEAAYQVAPGGSVSIPVLRRWVDPDGDPMFVQSTEDDAAWALSVSPNGTVVYQAQADAPAQTVTIPITISDTGGATATEQLRISITAKPSLQVEDFGLMTAVDTPVTVDPSSHIRGAVGTPKITSATTTEPDAATVNVDSAGTTFGFTSSKVGSYPITMTVADVRDGSDTETVTATVRITVVDADQSLLSTTPVTVFVRPQTDTSVDVFSAVQNPTGRVLLLSEPKPKPTTGASLDVDVVGESQLRVRGSTADGQPGLLGTIGYTVSDGGSDPSFMVKGVATVYLLPDAAPRRPVAVNDSVTVRAGAQVDIPVLSNDVGPTGEVVQLDPASVTIQNGKGLAFASGQVLRYLAPDTGGTVTLRYSAYTSGNPADESQATVTITVLPPGGDRPPQPVTLTGRVVAGSSVRIPFSSYGIDPDGDTVVLDRILTQPEHGSAQISGDGSAIIYTSLAGTHDQEHFSYEVRDSGGETSRATVLIGVLDAQTDPAPVTFSDYVQVEAGSGNQVVVQPTANDVDPGGGDLELDGVVPNAPAGSALYKLLQQHLKQQTGSQVIVTATDAPTTLTYTYSVKNSSGDVGAGLIVVKVVQGRVNDYPVVSDTVVGAEQRGRLDQGIDVVSGKVSWGSGEVSSLKLSLWGHPDGVSVSGDEITVSRVPNAGELIPFKLSGVDFTGKPAYTYGFLRIPALSDVILALKESVSARQVKEGGSTSFDMAKLVTVPDGDVLNVQASGVSASGTRKGASCTVQGTVVTYTAGDGEPWVDSCRVPVRLYGQQEYTLLAVPIDIIPLQPEPELRPASLTANPGAEALQYALTQMTTWRSHSELSALRYSISYTGSLFTVEQHGQTLSVQAKDTASPGLEDVVKVSIAGYPDATANITLKVGPAPSTRPVGGATSLSCSEANGTSCQTTVVGLRGESNSYQTPLKVVAVDASAPGCDGVTFSVKDSRTVAANWSDSTSGGSCTVRFTVEDAQGRISASGQGGTLAFELQGYPSAPASVAQIGYSGDSVTLAVTPGSASTAFPALSGFDVYQDGKQVAQCSAAGDCPKIGGLRNGEKHTFTVRSVNAVGESKQAVSTTAWAFAQPSIGDIDVTPIFDAQRTTRTAGWFRLTIPNSDSTASSYRVTIGGNAQDTLPASGGATTTATYSATPGEATQVSVTPVSEYPVPPGQPTDAQAASKTVVTAGLPALSWSGGGFSTDDDSITINGGFSGDANGSTKQGSYLYVASEGADPNCTNTGGAGISTSAGVSSSSQTISGLQQFHTYTVYACYTNQYGAAELTLGQATVWNQPAAPGDGTYTYTISNSGSGVPDYQFDGPPTSSSSPPSGYHAVFSGYPSDYGQTPDITVKYCDSSGNFCSPSSAVTRADGSAPFRMQVTATASQCSPQTDGTDTVSEGLSGNGVAQAQQEVTVTGYEYSMDGGTTWLPATGSGPAPAGTTQVRNVSYHVTWGVSGFDPYDGTDSAETGCN